ncbi:hypothetical protein [Streptomyces sp. PU-14G]|uniref:hypothetical protein n=1 Tax=Streptomyces sp. PU-14G TaxID=2800808 RepID=UPI0034E04675
MSNAKRLVLASLIMVVVPACGGSDREYRVPDNLCGISVKPDTVKPFLPGGKELHENDHLQWKKKSGGSCRLSVDGEEELHVDGSWAVRSTLKARGYDTDHGTRLLGGRYYLGPRRASAYFPCFNPEARLGAPPKDGKPRTVPADTYIVEVESRHVPEDGAESKKAMKRFIVPFAEAVKEQAPCR